MLHLPFAVAMASRGRSSAGSSYRLGRSSTSHRIRCRFGSAAGLNATSAVAGKMSSKAAAFSIAALLGLPTSSPEEERTVVVNERPTVSEVASGAEDDNDDCDEDMLTSQDAANVEDEDKPKRGN